MTWRMQGQWLTSCRWGDAAAGEDTPAPSVCQGIIGMHILAGHCDEVPLGGVTWVVTHTWPGPAGRGLMAPFIDAGATAVQRQTLLGILRGDAGGPFFETLSTMVTRIEEPRFVPITFAFDLLGQQAHVAMPGVVELRAEPVDLPTSGEASGPRVCIPKGCAPMLAALGFLTTPGDPGAPTPAWTTTHTVLAELDHTPAGVVQVTYGMPPRVGESWVPWCVLHRSRLRPGAKAREHGGTL